MIGVKKISHATYETPDLDRQIEYYTDFPQRPKVWTPAPEASNLWGPQPPDEMMR
jgi:hypothetical protein